MPGWIFLLLFCFAFLMAFGIISVLSKSPGQVQVRLAEASGHPKSQQKGPRPTLKVKASMFRIFRIIVFELIKFLPIRPKDPKLLQRLAWAGFHGPESAPVFMGARFFIGGALFFLYTSLALAGPGAKGQGMTFAIMLGLLGFLMPNIWLSRRIRKRQVAIEQSLPDSIDLLIICVEAGQGLDQAMARVGQEMEYSDPVFSRELHIMDIELRTGKSRADALRNLYARSGVEDLKSFAAMLIQADRYGVSMADSLRVFSESMRTKRRLAAEEAAAKTTLKIAFPLVLFIFPALLLIILAPAIIQVMGGLF